jgi:hypothetical protein
MGSARRVTRRRRRGQNEERQVDGQGVLVCVAVAAAPLIPLSSRRRRAGGGGPTANEWARGGSQDRTHHFGRCLRLRGERKGGLVVCVLLLQQRVSI